jgi:hypothetical protein
MKKSILITFFCLISLLSFGQNEDLTYQIYTGSNKLNNVKFKLELAKVIVYSEIPEILDQQNLILYKSKKVKITPTSPKGDAFDEMNFQEFSSNLPKVEILKSKLVTFLYAGGTEENLLLNNINRSASTFDTLVTTIKFQSEKKEEAESSSEEVVVFDNSEENPVNPLEWKIVSAGKEAYLSLSAPHLERLGYHLFPTSDNVEDYNPNEYYDYQRKYINQRSSPTEKAFILDKEYLFIGKAKNKEKSRFLWIPTQNLTFLFKLITID